MVTSSFAGNCFVAGSDAIMCSSRYIIRQLRRFYRRMAFCIMLGFNSSGISFLRRFRMAYARSAARLEYRIFAVAIS